MRVLDRIVMMPMRVRLRPFVAAVRVLMMLVVHVQMLVVERLVRVPVRVLLRQ